MVRGGSGSVVEEGTGSGSGCGYGGGAYSGSGSVVRGESGTVVGGVRVPGPGPVPGPVPGRVPWWFLVQELRDTWCRRLRETAI